jgi:hypothetical protein
MDAIKARLQEVLKSNPRKVVISTRDYFACHTTPAIHSHPDLVAAVESEDLEKVQKVLTRLTRRKPISCDPRYLYVTEVLGKYSVREDWDMGRDFLTHEEELLSRLVNLDH